MRRDTKTIGSILLDVELVNQENIERALDIQKQTGKRLGEVLVSLGLVSDDDIRWALAEQLNLPYVNIRKDQIDLDVATLIPEKLARRYHVIPILKIDRELTVVVDDPLNTTIINDIERITRSQVKISLGRTSDILLAIDEIYGFSKDAQRHEVTSPPHFTSPWFSEGAVQRILNDLSGQALLEYILTVASQHDVSHIYFQPGETMCRVNYRTNTGLQEQVRLNAEWYAILLFRLKIHAGCDVAELTHPLHEEFSYQFTFEQPDGAQSQIRLDVTLLPTTAGEAVVVRVINKPVTSIWILRRDVERTARQQQELEEFHHIYAFAKYLQTGAVLLGGTSYAENISTLYALLDAFDPTHTRIITIESSAEYSADAYSQIRYSRERGKQKGLADKNPASFTETREQLLSHAVRSYYSASHIAHPEQQRLSAWIRLIQEQDADILLVDHIASPVVLAQCLDFAAQGVLFTALEQHHVFDMLAYLLDCQVEPSVVTSQVSALMAQHSVRLLCEHCKQPDPSGEWQQLLAPFHVTGDAPHGDAPEVYAPQGCSDCHMTGYTDSLTLFEQLRMAPWLKEALRSGRSLAEIQHTAEERGFVSLRKKSQDLFYAGFTSLEDVFSIIL